MNRRDLLKSMIALPVATTLGCSTFTSKAQTASTTFTTMNLVFEGPFIFFMDNPQVRVFAPKVDGHRYLINNAKCAGINLHAWGRGWRRECPENAV